MFDARFKFSCVFIVFSVSFILSFLPGSDDRLPAWDDPDFDGQAMARSSTPSAEGLTSLSFFFSLSLSLVRLVASFQVTVLVPLGPFLRFFSLLRHYLCFLASSWLGPPSGALAVAVVHFLHVDALLFTNFVLVRGGFSLASVTPGTRSPTCPFTAI